MIKPSKHPLLLLATISFVIFSSLLITAKAHDMDEGDMESGMGMTSDEYWALVQGDPFKATGKTRTYYIAAIETEWDYAPDGYDKVTGKAFDARGIIYTERKADRIGSKYIKCLYREFTDSTFKKLKPRPEKDEHVGMLGPVIRAEVGDTVKVVFKNQCKFPASIFAHSIYRTKDNEGAPYNDGTSGKYKLDDIIQPGKTFTYTWFVPERCGPGPMDGSSVMWMYHSGVDEDIDFAAGLVGFIAVTRKGMACADGSPKDVDRELFFMYSVSNENISPYLPENWRKYPNPKPPANSLPPTDDQGFTQANNKFAINGYIFGNGPMISMKQKQRVRWYTMSMGRGFDNHTPHVHGNDYVIDGLRVDIVSTIPGEMAVADMCPNNPGIWLYHCHVGNHVTEGMITRYEVKKC